MKKSKIKNQKQLLEVLNKIPYVDNDHRNKIVCSLIGHSRISTTCFGYRYCARCGEQVGDNLGSVDYGVKEAVIVGHNCKICKRNYKKCDWRDKLFVANPFKQKMKKSKEK